jgi:hypothetical protein
MEPKQRETLVKRIYELTWAFRAVMNTNGWATPPVDDALQFAMSEVGEVADAEIRGRNYARNNDRSPEVVAELADVAFMLATALPMGQVPLSNITAKPSRFLPSTPERIRLDSIAYLVAGAWHDWMSLRFTSAEAQAAQALHMIVARLGADAEQEVAKRFLRIYGKHAQATHDVPDVVFYLQELVEGVADGVEGDDDGEL